MVLWIALALCLVLTGCGSGQETYTWQGAAPVLNLDPQVTDQPGDLLALRHLFRGLFRTDGQGQPQPDGCQSWTQSEDGLEWTFTLDPDLVWWDGRKVTARDYAAGIARALDPDTGSPYREALSPIAAVDCPREDTLVITLNRQEDLTRLLCLAGTYPCREDFFQAAQGSYGLTPDTTLGCGVYQLSGWGSDLVTLTRCQGQGIHTLRLAGPDWEGTPTGRLVQAQGEEGLSLVTWALCLNPRQSPFTQTQVCQGVASALYAAALPLSPGLARAGQLFPPSLGQEDCLPQLGPPGPLLWEGLEALGLDRVQGLTLLVPEDPRLQALGTSLNQELQQQLGIFCSVEVLPPEELLARVEAGDYDLALTPCRPESGEGEEFLLRWAKLAGSQAATQQDLLWEGRIIPLCYQLYQLETSQPVEGLWLNPYTGSPDFTQAHWP